MSSDGIFPDEAGVKLSYAPYDLKYLAFGRRFGEKAKYFQLKRKY